MKRLLLISVLSVGLVACTSQEVRGNLGLNRRSPDAFNVVSRPPLTVPKEFILTPPEMEAGAVLGSKPDEKARAILLGSSANMGAVGAEPQPNPQDGVLGVLNAPSVGASIQTQAKTTADQALLGKAGAQKANPNIKQELRSDAWKQEKAKEDASLLDEFRDGLGGSKQDVTLDPTKEAQELKEKNIPTAMPVK